MKREELIAMGISEENVEKIIADYGSAVQREQAKAAELKANPYIEQLIKQARNEVVSKRNYPKSYTDEKISEDLKQFEDVIVNLSVYDHSQAGEAYMASYSENGVSRSWKDRESLFVGVFPFVKSL